MPISGRVIKVLNLTFQKTVNWAYPAPDLLKILIDLLYNELQKLLKLIVAVIGFCASPKARDLRIVQYMQHSNTKLDENLKKMRDIVAKVNQLNFLYLDEKWARNSFQ